MKSVEKKSYGKLTLIAAAVSLALLSGCSVMHPMRAPPDLPVLPVVLKTDPLTVLKDMPTANGSKTNRECEFAGCMEKAIEYADVWRRFYYDEAASTQLWRNSLLVTLLPISAISLYRTTHFDNAQKLVGGYAAAGGAMYGMTRYFGLPPQQKTLLTASHTLSCTILNARASLVPISEFDELDQSIRKLTTALPQVQKAYREIEVAVSREVDTDAEKDVRAKVIAPLRKQVAFYESLHARAVALRDDNRTSGEVLRRQVDLITTETAAQLASEFPEPDKLLELITGFQVTADKIGVGAFPAAAIPPAVPPPPLPPAPTPIDVAVEEVVAETTAKVNSILDPQLAYVTNSRPAVKEFSGIVGALAEQKLLTGAFNESTLRDAAATLTFQTGDDNKQAKRETEFFAAAKKAINAKTESVKKVDAKKKATEDAAKKAKLARAKSTPPPVSLSTFDQLLEAMKESNVIEIQGKSGESLEFKATFKRTANGAEVEAAQEKAKNEKESTRKIAIKVAKFGQLEKVQNAYNMIGDARIPAESVYHHLRGLVATKTTVLKDCKPDAEKEPPPFTISPEVTDITLIKDKPAEFVVSNNKQIPKVAISGKNTDKIKQEVKLKGVDFIVVLTASDVIPDGEEAVLTVTDFTGKRKFDIKIEAKVAN